MSFKKLLSVLLVLALALSMTSVLAACNSNKDTDETTNTGMIGRCSHHTRHAS